MDRHAHRVPVVRFQCQQNPTLSMRRVSMASDYKVCIIVCYTHIFVSYIPNIHTYTYMQVTVCPLSTAQGISQGLPSDTTIVMSLQSSRLQSTTYALKPAYRYCCSEGMIGLFENHFDLTSKCPGRKSRADVSLFDNDRVFFPSLLRRFFT